MLQSVLLALMASVADAKVHQLNANNFDSFVEENPKALVKFYAPWCGHCKKLAPEWEAASDVLEGKMVLAEMNLDEDENKAMKTRFSIKGFPTIKYFDSGDVMDYDGGRTKDTIVSWAKQMTSEPVIFLGGRPEVEDVKAEFPGKALLAYEGSMRPGNPEFGNYQAFCKDHRSLIQCMAYPGQEGEQPVMELFRPSNTSTRVPFDWETTAEEMKKFVRGEKLEYFAPISGDNYSTYIDSGIEMVWFVGSPEQYEEIKSKVEDVAQKTRGHFAWVWLDSVKMARQADGMLGVSEGPAFVIRAPEGQKGSYRGPMTMDVTEEELLDFVKEVQDGKRELSLKSEEIPEADDEPVRTLVGKNLKEVTEAAEEYFLMIHAPWCGHCKSFKPVYDEVATKLKAEGSNVMFSMIDGTANDITVPGLDYTGFPTIYYKGPKSKRPVKYTSGRDAESLFKYLKENGSGDFDLEKVLGEKKDDGKDEL